MLMYRGERRKLSIDMTASLNGATGSNPAVTIHRARGMADVTAELLDETIEATDFSGNVIEFWVEAADWTEIARLKVRATCTSDNSEVPVEREVPLLIQ